MAKPDHGLRHLRPETREFHKVLTKIGPYRDLDLFRDFCALTRLSFLQVGNRMLGAEDPKIESEYQAIRARYSREAFEGFSRCLSILTEAMEAEPDDFLGQTFMALELGNEYAGQYFTPFNVALAMAEMNAIGADRTVAEKGVITICEPSAGSGVMVIAFAEALRRQNLNPQLCLRATLIDIDRLCCDMSFVHMCLLGIPALVVHGNSLSLEVWAEMPTPWWLRPVPVAAALGTAAMETMNPERGMAARKRVGSRSSRKTGGRTEAGDVDKKRAGKGTSKPGKPAAKRAARKPRRRSKDFPEAAE